MRNIKQICFSDEGNTNMDTLVCGTIHKVVFRVDSSTVIGSGHLMRCLTLAARLQKQYQAEIFFLSRDLLGNLAELAQKKGYQLVLLPRAEENTALVDYGKWLTVTQDQDAQDCIDVLRKEAPIDMLVVDSYAIDAAWENQLRPFVRKIMVIDDLANRKHDCDILLDQNFYLDKDTRYQGLVPKNCQLCLGPQHVLLREEFYEVKKHLRERDGEIHNILVFYGGSDLTNETLKALQAIIRLKTCSTLTVNVIVGASNPYKTKIEAFCQQYDFFHYYCQVDNIAEFMDTADLALGAGGTTTWERCFLGLPAFVTAIAENQVRICKECSRAGYIQYLGRSSEVTVQRIYKNLVMLFKRTNLLELILSCRLDVE